MKYQYFPLVLALCFATQVLPTHLSAQSTAGSNEFKAVFTESPPNVDGNLDDQVWQTIAPITSFTQVWPDDGAAPTEHSEVRIAYDRDFLYFAFNFLDDNPELIRAKNLERGGRNDRDDHAYISLDTFQDGRNAYLFEMNALGTQDDATISDEGLTLDSFSWDAVFRSETQITDKGWTMEVSIPFRQLRFPEGDDLSFGLMLSRMINRKNERVMWPAIGLEFGGNFGAFGVLSAVSQYGRLTGLKNIRRGKNIEIKPYIITGAQKSRASLSEEITTSDFTKDLGVDVKYGITSNLTLDLTVNTDFAQVESDNVQLNLTRFSLFFPEKREFFLERSGLFEHGNSRSTQTFFSRRIGLSDNILAGARVTGQVGRFSVGLLNIETGQELKQFLGNDSANNTVARIRTSVFPRATVGAILTNVSTAEGRNTSLGLDAQYRFYNASEFNTWITQVNDDNLEREGRAGHVGLSIQNDTYAGGVEFTGVGENYFPALGFVRRRDMRRLGTALTYKPIVEWSAVPLIRRVTFDSDLEFIAGQDGEKQSNEIDLTTTIEFNRRDNLSVGVTRSFERLESDFEIRPNAIIEADDYTFNQLGVRGQTDSSRRTFGSGFLSTGGFFSGNRTDLGATLGFRQSQYLQMEGGLIYSSIDLPTDNGEFTATTASLSILGALNRKLFAKALIQYDNFSRDMQANIRVDWIHTPGSDLFFVFNTSYHLTEEGEDIFDPRRDLLLNDRVAVAKLTYLILI